MAIDNNFWSNFSNKKNIIAAHRGNRSEYAENTMYAFEKSLGKCDFIELDVSFSKDGVAIIIHDDTLSRTSNINEFDEFKHSNKVYDYTYKQLLKLDFSSWFAKCDPFDTIKNNIISVDEIKSADIQRILTLEEVLSFSKINNIPLNIELKNMENTQFNKKATKIITNIIKKFDIDNLILLSSFNHKYIEELNILLPNISKAALQEKKHPDNLIKYLKKLQVSAYHCDLDIINEDVIKKLHTNNIKTNVYTVNDKKEKKKLFNIGVYAIFTDFL